MGVRCGRPNRKRESLSAIDGQSKRKLRSTIDETIKGDGKESQKMPVEDTGEGQWGISMTAWQQAGRITAEQKSVAFIKADPPAVR